MFFATPSSGDLIVQRARILGGGERRALEHGLASIIVNDITEGDEILLVPHLAAKAHFRSTGPPTLFATGLTDQLRAVRHNAQVDPIAMPSNTSALLFTSRATFAAWLVAVHLRGETVRAKAAYGEGIPLSNFAAWQRQVVFRHGPAMVAVAVRLARQALLIDWISRFSAEDQLLIGVAMERAYGLSTGSYASDDKISDGPLTPPGFQKLEDKQEDGGLQPQSVDILPIHLAAAIAPLLRRHFASHIPAFAALAPASRRLAVILISLARQPNIGPYLTPAVVDRLVETAIGRILPGPGRRAVSDQAASPEQPVFLGKHNAPTPINASPKRPAAAHTGNGQAGGRRAFRAGGEQSTQTPAYGEFRMPPYAAQPEPQGHEYDDSDLITVSHIRTDFGGLFFLANALIALGFYPDFTRPLDRPLEPSLFWLLDRLGLRLFGKAYRADPLHRWFAANALPGKLPLVWKVQRGWFAAIPEGHFYERPSRHRRIFWDSRGFALLDAPMDAVQRWSARRFAFAGQAMPPPRRHKARKLPSSRNARWLGCLTEFLAFRLSMASDGLGFGDLRLPAHIDLGIEKIDVHLDLNRLPIALRLAGLDRNPGWLPSEGRSLAFHFS